MNLSSASANYQQTKPTLRKDRLEPLSPELKGNFPSPLDLFPSKHDTISKALFGVEAHKLKSNKRKLQDNVRWLYADKIDADFGLTGDSQSDTIRRAYRRIESSALFSPVKAQDAPLSEIVPSNNPLKRFVVVEESRLQELMKLENTLRKEKQLLGEQCGWALPDYEVNACIPIPATRLAVQSFCQQQMQRISKEVILLKQNWEAFCRQNHYNKPHLYIKDSYIKNAPVSQRALKLRLVRSAVETWRLRKDRDSMLFEDDLSYLSGKYHEARIRQQDYERYYILASRYGPYSEKEFNRDPRPGRRYFIAASRGAIKLQLLWDRFWSMAKLRRYRATRIIQKYYRRHYCYKQYHPIINLRLKIGKKTYYMYCWHAWLHYNHLCRTIKEALNYQFNTFIKNNFLAWKRHTKETKEARELRARQIVLRAKNTIAYFKFRHWARYAKHNRMLKIRLRRLFGFPHFDLWIQHVRILKHQKNLHMSAYKLQSIFKTILLRKKFLLKKSAQKILCRFNVLVLCVRKVRTKRQERIMADFQHWSPTELHRRNNRANEIERQRLIKKQQFVSEKEKGALAGLRKHLNSKDGQLNLDELLRLASTEQRMHSRYPDKKFELLNKEEKCKLVARSLGEDCSRIIRLLESHNYNTKHGAFIQCADVCCRATCTSEAQYHNHLQESEPHCGNPPQFSEFHMLLRNQRGQDILRSYLTRLHGMGGAVGYLDAYFALQEWKKLPTSSETYESKALNILELYLLSDSPRKLDLSFPEAEAMVVALQSVKNKEHKGLYRLCKAKAGLMRGLLGVGGQEYYEFTTEGVLSPDVFQHLEWHCFRTLFDTVERDSRFRESSEFLAYQQLRQEELQHRHEELVKDYERYRLMSIQQWTRNFCTAEKAMFDKAGEIVDVFLRRECEVIYRKMEAEEVQRRAVELRHIEQSQFEASALLVEDVVYWTEDDILNHIFQHYIASLVDRMLELPECRKGLLQYSGYLKTASRHMHVDLASNTGKEEWFTDFFKNARMSEKGALPDGAVAAATVIQRRIRGIMGRKKARKVFMRVYVKMFDSYSNAAYYNNTKTGESSWTRPAMTRHLYHKSNW